MSEQKIEAKRVSENDGNYLYDVFVNDVKVMKSVPYACFLRYLSNIHEVPEDEQ